MIRKTAECVGVAHGPRVEDFPHQPTGEGAARRFWRGLAFAEAQPVAKGIVNLEGFSPRLVHDFRPPVAVILVP